MHLRIVTYNVRALQDDRASVVRTLRELDPDVVCLQEVPQAIRWRSRCAALARESGLLYVTGGGTTGGVALLSALRVDVPHAIEYRFSRTPGLMRRGCAAARVSAGGASCVVAAFHLGLDAAERARHRRELVAVADRFGEDVSVLAGDVNDRPGGPVWSEIAGEFTDAAATAGGDDPTYPSWRPEHRIDGIFVRGPAKVTSHTVVNDDTARLASDHLPVVADLLIGE